MNTPARTASGFRKAPEGVQLGPLSKRVFEVLAEHTSFPWPVMQAQSKRVGADPAALEPDDLRSALPHLAEAVGRFTSPERRALVEAELRALL